MLQAHNYYYAVLQYHWNTRLETEASLSEPFIKWYWRKTMKRETRLPESCKSAT